MARMLAAKAALMVRKDALGEDEGDAELGIEVRAKLERRIKNLEEGHVCISLLWIFLYSKYIITIICSIVHSNYTDALCWFSY